MYPPLWTSLLVAMHDEIENTSVIYLQNECIEKYQFELCSKYDGERDFDVILG